MIHENCHATCLTLRGQIKIIKKMREENRADRRLYQDTIARNAELESMIREDRLISNKILELTLSMVGVNELVDFFNDILGNVENIFKIRNVWISLIREDELVQRIFEHESKFLSKSIVNYKLNIIDGKTFRSLLKNKIVPTLFNDSISSYLPLHPKNLQLVESLAVIPMRIGREGKRVIGSLNFGDKDVLHFSPDKDIRKLENIVALVSICLEKCFLYRDDIFLDVY